MCLNKVISLSLSLKLFSFVAHFINFKHNFPKEIEIFFQKQIKMAQREKLEDAPIFVCYFISMTG